MPSLTVGRYTLHRAIASGGMATVYLGRMLGDAGFSRLVAIKRLHPQIATDREFSGMLLDEARLATRIRHPNVVATLDVVKVEDELLVAMEYVEGESLAGVLKKLASEGKRIPLPVVSSLFLGALAGLHAAHEAKNERGEPLGLIHRDISPQNLMIGVDGVARIIDFGVAKVVNIARSTTTVTGQVKGKLSYMAPEQLRGESISRRVDVFAASVMLWETLTGQRLFAGGEAVILVLEQRIPPPSEIVPDLPPELDAVVLKGLARDPSKRFATALELSDALEAIVPPASAQKVAAWLAATVPEEIAQRSKLVVELEASENENPEPTVVEKTRLTDRNDYAVAVDAPRSSGRALLGMLLLLALGIVAALVFWQRESRPGIAPPASPPVTAPLEPLGPSAPSPSPLPSRTASATPAASAPAAASMPARSVKAPRGRVPLYGQD